MIQGYFSSGASRRRPFVRALFEFPTLGRQSLVVELLIDTGADRTVLAPRDAMRLGINLDHLPSGAPSTGVGGRMSTRSVEAILTLDTFSTTFPLTILAPQGSPLPIPSLLGRDVLSHFALFLEARTERVLLLEPAEADRINLP